MVEYFIQEYKIQEEDGVIRIKTNGYKTNTLKKILKIIERTVHGNHFPLSPFLKEIIKLPPVNSHA